MGCIVYTLHQKHRDDFAVIHLVIKKRFLKGFLAVSLDTLS